MSYTSSFLFIEDNSNINREYLKMSHTSSFLYVEGNSNIDVESDLNIDENA